MTILNVRDENTGEFVAVDVDAPSGNLYIRDADTGEFLLLDLSAPTGIVKVIDANTGEFVSIDYATPSGTLNVIDPNTGEFLAIDLASPVGTLYNLDDKTGEFVQLDISTAKFFKSSNVVLGGTPAPTYETPSYANSGGTGDRRAIIIISTTLTTGGTLNNLLNGSDIEDNFYFGSAPAAGLSLTFQFNSKKIISEITMVQRYSAATHGVWQVRGSDNGTDWTNIGGTFTLGGTNGANAITAISANTTPYIYYQLFGISGSTDGGPYIEEFKFKIGNPL